MSQITYTPAPPPQDLERLPVYLYSELIRLGVVLSNSTNVPTLYQEPQNPVEGDLVVSDIRRWDAATYTGDHDGANNAAVLTDTSQAWTVNALIGLTLTNKTDGSSTTVTANTATTITGVLAGGTDDDWDIGDEYTLTGTNGFYIYLNGTWTLIA